MEMKSNQSDPQESSSPSMMAKASKFKTEYVTVANNASSSEREDECETKGPTPQPSHIQP
jgi:hypothetical protein